MQILSCRVTQIKTYSWDNAQVVLVGNKCDMEEERVISYERGRQLADQLGIEFFETSAKDNVNVKVNHIEFTVDGGPLTRMICGRKNSGGFKVFSFGQHTHARWKWNYFFKCLNFRIF